MYILEIQHKWGVGGNKRAIVGPFTSTATAVAAMNEFIAVATNYCVDYSTFREEDEASLVLKEGPESDRLELRVGKLSEIVEKAGWLAGWLLDE